MMAASDYTPYRKILPLEEQIRQRAINLGLDVSCFTDELGLNVFDQMRSYGELDENYRDHLLETNDPYAEDMEGLNDCFRE